MKAKSALAANVQSYRKRRGMSTDDVAAGMVELGHPKWTNLSVVGVENDRRDINGYELNALAAVLETTRDDLLPPDSLSSGASGRYLTQAA